MRVLLKRPIFTPVGHFLPDPYGVEVPDSLHAFILSIADAEVLDEPDEVAPVPDPDTDPSAGSFVEVMNPEKPNPKRSVKRKPKVDPEVLKRTEAEATKANEVVDAPEQPAEKPGSELGKVEEPEAEELTETVEAETEEPSVSEEEFVVTPPKKTRSSKSTK